MKYGMDDIDRLIKADEGTLSGGSITGRTRDQEWTLSHTGNWDVNKIDLNGDDDFADGGETNDTRVHNAANEITEWNSGNVVPDYDAAGNLTDDKVDYEYEWDAFYRLRKVKKTSNQALVAEYRYNGLGYRIGEHVDTDTDNDVDGSDLWYYDAFDENWRQVARFRSSDTSPKEQFVAHQAGLDGRGGSSYIDLVACRNKDADTSWTNASDTVLEERIYYCQNWRADVSALVKSDGKMLEWVKYSSYGVPFGLPNGDSNSDGDCDSADSTQISAWSGVSYDVRGDIDLDGDVDSTDVGAIQIGVTCGRSVLSAISSHRGFAGTSYISAHNSYEMRTRIYDPSLGRWISRDRLEYGDGMNLYGAFSGSPIIIVDPFGTTSVAIKVRESVSGCQPNVHVTYNYSDNPCGTTGHPTFIQEIHYIGSEGGCNDDWSNSDTGTIVEAGLMFGPTVQPDNNTFSGNGKGWIFFQINMYVACTFPSDVDPQSIGHATILHYDTKTFPYVHTGALSSSWFAGQPLQGPVTRVVFLEWNCCPNSIGGSALGTGDGWSTELGQTPIGPTTGTRPTPRVRTGGEWDPTRREWMGNPFKTGTPPYHDL